MSYAPYANYKESGIPWLPMIPEGWISTRVKYVAPFQVGWTPPTGRDENYEGDNLWANISDLKARVIFDTKNRISDQAAAAASMEISPRGSLLYSFKLSVGAMSFAGAAMYTNEAIASFLPARLLCLDYLYYSFGEFIVKNAAENIYGAKILNQDLIKAAALALPASLEQQAAIANFLDRETAKIDILIDKQEQLIKLLEEKRQAVISHAVTKGLNPDVRMKDSGVEWLGEVPEDWSCLPIKYICSLVKDGTHLPPQRVDVGIPLLSVRNIVNGRFVLREDDSNISVEDYWTLRRSFVPHEQDVLLAIVGATLGKTAIVEEMPEFHIQRSLAIFRCRDPYSPKYLNLVFQSRGFQELLWQNVGFSAQPGIYLGALANFRVPVPSPELQKAIVTYCEECVGRFNAVIGKATAGVDLLKERRTSLISAAVTGKIDVRNAV